MNPRRLYIVVQAAVGTWLLVWPRFAAAITARRARPAPSWLARMLGIRLLVQAGLLARRPTSTVVSVETAVEALHGASMLCAARLVPDRHRTALSAAAVAGGLVFIGVAARSR
jgi:hypothetical protein